MAESAHKKIKIINIVGARPNFMKMAPLYVAYRKHPDTLEPILVHTKQHSDKKMSGVFFETLGLPDPDYSLSLDATTPSGTIAQIMSQLEVIFETEQPNLVLVVGDVNSTLAAALTANKKQIKVAHVESGLRSGDKTMPEEVNRILTDNISDWLFVTEKSGILNLQKENINNSTFLVGNVMIDNLINMLPQIESSDITERLGLSEKYIVMTMHRPANVDTEEGLNSMIQIIESVADEDMNIVFPVHPRTLNNLKKYPEAFKTLNEIQKLTIVEPMEYIDFMKLVKGSVCVLTDSGGIQEEAAYLKIPTITLRESTERPSTVECGANHICPPQDETLVMETIKKVLKMKPGDISDIELNDGKTSDRIIEILLKSYK